MRYMIDDSILSAGPRTLVWAFSDQTHMLLSESDDFDMWVLVLARETLRPSGPYPPPFAHKTVGRSGAYLLPPDVHAELTQVAINVRASSDQAILSAGLRWWAIRAWASCNDHNAAHGYQSHPAVQRAVEILQDQPHLPLAAIARAAHLSQSHLNRLFREEVGQSLGGYRSQCRLLAVDKTMTETTSPNMLNAALDAGFGCYSQFYRTFRAARGISPRSYYSHT